MSTNLFILSYFCLLHFLNDYIKCLSFGTHDCLKINITTIHYQLSSFDFFNSFIVNSRPILFKNAARPLPAFDLWTDSYLRYY